MLGPSLDSYKDQGGFMMPIIINVLNKTNFCVFLFIYQIQCKILSDLP